MTLNGVSVIVISPISDVEIENVNMEAPST
jgi:hypothetical protein